MLRINSRDLNVLADGAGVLSPSALIKASGSSLIFIIVLASPLASLPSHAKYAIYIHNIIWTLKFWGEDLIHKINPDSSTLDVVSKGHNYLTDFTLQRLHGQRQSTE